MVKKYHDNENNAEIFIIENITDVLWVFLKFAEEACPPGEFSETDIPDLCSHKLF